MPAPLTPNDVVIQLAGLARELDQTVKALESADRDATEKRAVHDLAFSTAFLTATGSMDMRKHLAVVECHQQRLDADVADTVVRHLRRRIDAIKTRIDVGRSYGAAIRSEMALAGYGGET
jgi:hypothetical protein